jgi:hypothetical protein
MGKKYTSGIHAAVNDSSVPKERYWASSAIIDPPPLYKHLSPAYASTPCLLSLRIAILNQHSANTVPAHRNPTPSARAALDAGVKWGISVSCSGAPKETDTFAQALWVVDSMRAVMLVQLIYTRGLRISVIRRGIMGLRRIRRAKGEGTHVNLLSLRS